MSPQRMPAEFRLVGREQFDAVVKQRDEARAEVDRLTAALYRAHRALDTNGHTTQTRRDKQWEQALHPGFAYSEATS